MRLFLVVVRESKVKQCKITRKSQRETKAVHNIFKSLSAHIQYNTITPTIKNTFCCNSTYQLGPQKIQPSLQVALCILMPTLYFSRTEVISRETRPDQNCSAPARISLPVDILVLCC